MNEDIKAVARRIWEEVFPRCQLEVLPEVVHPDWYNHAPPTDRYGLAGARATVTQLRDAFDDLRYEILDVITPAPGRGWRPRVVASPPSRSTSCASWTARPSSTGRCATTSG